MLQSQPQNIDQASTHVRICMPLHAFARFAVARICMPLVRRICMPLHALARFAVVQLQPDVKLKSHLLEDLAFLPWCAPFPLARRDLFSHTDQTYHVLTSLEPCIGYMHTHTHTTFASLA